MVLARLEHAVIVSAPVDEGFFGYYGLDPWLYRGPEIGWHAMCIVGYDDERHAFKVRNSWGDEWSDQGYLWMDYDNFVHPSGPAPHCDYANQSIRRADSESLEYRVSTLRKTPLLFLHFQRIDGCIFKRLIFVFALPHRR